MLLEILSTSGKLLWKQKSLLILGALILLVPFLFKVLIIIGLGLSAGWNFEIIPWAFANKWAWLALVSLIGILSWVVSVIGSAGIYSKGIASERNTPVTSSIRKYIKRFFGLTFVIGSGIVVITIAEYGPVWARWFFYEEPSFQHNNWLGVIYWLISWFLSVLLALGKAAIVSDDTDVITSIKKSVRIIKKEIRPILIFVLGMTLFGFLPLDSFQGLGWLITASIPWSDPFIFEYDAWNPLYLILISFLLQVVIVTFTQIFWAISYLRFTRPEKGNA